MSHMSASFASVAAGAHVDDEVTAQSPIAVYNCSRLGRSGQSTQLLVHRLVPLRPAAVS